MNVIVTRNKVDYGEKFLKVATLKEVSRIVGNIDVLVLNSSAESESDKTLELINLKGKVNDIVYICEEVSTETSIKMLILGYGGRYFSDTFFLCSKEELSNLLRSINEISALATLGGVSVLNDFVERYLKKDVTDVNPSYLQVLKEAVTSIKSDYNKKTLELSQMSETASDVFTSTYATIDSLMKDRKKLEDMIDNMKDNLDVSRTPMRRSGASSITMFPRFDYKKNKDIIRVKKVGDCPYLVSFFLGFRLYLEKQKNLRPKLIIILPVGGNYEKAYSDFTWVTSSSYKSGASYCEHTVFTNYPISDVLLKLLDDDNFGIFVVLDCTVSDRRHILNSKGPVVKYAVSGEGVIKKFNIDKSAFFTTGSSDIKGSLFNIPYSVDYPDSKSGRERYYLNNEGPNFEKLLVGLRVR